MLLLCGKLAAALRAGRIPNDRLDPQGASSFDCPLGAVDLSQTVLTGTPFHQIDSSAALNGAATFRRSDWAGTNWWDAQELDATLLVFLRDNYYPYANGNTNYLSVPPPATAYREKVLSLCKKAKIECSRVAFRYGPQSTDRVRQILAALSVPAVATLVTRANEGATVTVNPAKVQEQRAIAEWLRAGLCDPVASRDLQSGGLARTSAAGFGARRVHCTSIYGDVRRFLNSVVGPEYMIVTTEVGSQPEQKLPESVALASVGVRNAAISLSAEAIGFLLTNVPPITYTYQPGSGEQQLHRELVDLHLCALLTPPELLEYDRQNHHSQGTSVYGLDCASPDYQGMQDLVVSGLLPRYLATLTAK
ncbi:MAG TPA: hypothetical protein VI653_16445 [Steroidobacteraceae bacterium]